MAQGKFRGLRPCTPSRLIFQNFVFSEPLESRETENVCTMIALGNYKTKENAI